MIEIAGGIILAIVVIFVVLAVGSFGIRIAVDIFEMVSRLLESREAREKREKRESQLKAENERNNPYWGY